jgi:uncharacterized protein
MHIARSIYDKVHERLNPGKAVIIFGPRQAGKSTIMEEIARTSNFKIRRLDCDDATIRMRLEIQNLPNLQNVVGDAELLLIDEAQRVKNIGLTLKIIIDQIKNVRILVSGSSAFELANQINEPLTGRKWEFMLLPFSVQEMCIFHGEFEESQRISQRLLFGMYPEVVQNPSQERQILTQLAGSYLYKDVFNFQDLRRPELLDKLLKALALQVGHEVSYNNLATIVSSDFSTAQRYLDILEKAFIIFRLPSYSQNLRNELKKSRKYYFWDCGIRNAIIGDFRPLELRNDVGGLWENFLVAERMKRNFYSEFYGKSYFWRTAQQQEIDYLEEIDGGLRTFEFKWGAAKGGSQPITFKNAYPNSTFLSVNRTNYLDFLNEKFG